MKKITLSTLLVLVISLFSIQLNAQNAYTYTLVSNGADSFTISAVADGGGTNEVTEVQSYGFTILLPDGITMSITSSLGGAAAFNNISAANVTMGDPAITGQHAYLITETLAATVNFPNLPATGLPSTVVTIQVAGSPATGEISIMANDSTLGAAFGGALRAYMSADTENNDVFSPVVSTVTSGLSGTISYDFSVLGTKNVELESNKFSLYPNPSSDKFFVKGMSASATVSVFSMNGKKIFSVDDYTGESINISSLSSGLYLVSIESEESKEVRRLVIK